jgi:ClpP class serine protease
MQKVATALRIVFWLALIALVVRQLAAVPALERSRAAALGRIEAERHSRVIALIDREEGGSLFGVPVMQSISIDDSEAVLRAIRFTPDDQPIDIVLHTPGGTVLAAEQIARALIERKGKVTVFVPHYAMSGGTLIALAADEIVMDPNAVLGPVDPQIGELPAASIVRAVEIKGPQHVSDDTLIVADIAQKARVQVALFVAQLLGKHLPEHQAAGVAAALTEGRWTHDFPITVQMARSFGLKVSTDMPRSVYELMDLYPQTDGAKPSVWYVPINTPPLSRKETPS